MDDLAILRLMIEWGADEALGETALHRLNAVKPQPIAAVPNNLPKSMPPAMPPIIAPISRGGPRPMAAARATELASAADSVAALRAALATFDLCALRDTATHLVFADGNPDADLMLVGDGPGAEEDRTGKPFVGPAGRLLDQMLASIGLDRSHCLITNVIPWRPPGNRPPTETEVALCLPFLLRHIALTRPRHLVLLGGLASEAVLGSRLGIRRLRGRWHAATIPGLDQPVPALPLFHPDNLLRTPSAKRETWSDLLLLRRTLDSHDKFS